MDKALYYLGGDPELYREIILQFADEMDEKINHDSDILDKIRDIVDGTIDHLDRDDALDMLYEIKRLLK